MDIQVRRLKGKDIKTLAKVFSKFDPETMARVQRIAITSGGIDESAMLSVGLQIFQSVAKLTDDIWVWLADIAGMTPQELEEADFEAPKAIIKQLIQGGQLGDFFGDIISRPPKASMKIGTPSRKGTAGQMKLSKK